MEITKVKYPIARSHLDVLRAKNTTREAFRNATHSLSLLIATEVARNISREEKAPTIEAGHFEQILVTKAPDVYLVPVLRSGLAMLPAFLSIFPDARIGFIGGKDSNYYRISNPQTGNLIILDPMIATGETLDATITAMQRECVSCTQRVIIAGLVAAPKGLEALEQRNLHFTKSLFRVTNLYVASVDRCLNQDAYILPGLGDFGDRFFG